MRNNGNLSLVSCHLSLPMFATLVFLLGLAVGSFLNVVIFRLKLGKSFLFGRSFCPQCKKPIAWHDNIPLLSFALLGGRSRQCRKPISLEHPLVELSAGLIFLFLYWHFGLTFRFWASAILTAVLLVIFVYDLKYRQIPDEVALPAMIFAFFAGLYLKLGFWNLILAAVLGAGFFGSQYLISRGRWVGDGDIRLGALMGLMLGWQYLLVALFLAYLIGAGVSLVLLARKKKAMSSEIPFGPFLAAGTFIALIYGRPILAWYLNLTYY